MFAQGRSQLVEDNEIFGPGAEAQNEFIRCLFMADTGRMLDATLTHTLDTHGTAHLTDISMNRLIGIGIDLNIGIKTNMNIDIHEC